MPELLTTVFFLILAMQENLGRDFAASIGGNAGSAIFNSIIIPMLVIWVVSAVGSVPDTIISIKDAKKGNYDDALSNVLGSNILVSRNFGRPYMDTLLPFMFGFETV